MCQSHMEAPAVAGTTVGTETREETGALRNEGYRFRLGRKLRMVLDLVLGIGLWLVLPLRNGYARICNGAGRGACGVAEDRCIAVVRRGLRMGKRCSGTDS